MCEISKQYIWISLTGAINDVCIYIYDYICIYAWIQVDSPTSFHQIQERMDKVAMVCIWGSSHLQNGAPVW